MAKRTNGEGTIYQRANGLWCAELTIGYDENGKRIKKNFSSMDLDKLQKKVNDERYKLQRNIIIQKSDYTVAEWVKLWLETYKAATLKAKTYDLYEYNINKHIKNSIGEQRLDKIRPETLQQLFNDMGKKGYSASKIKSVYLTLRQAFEQAIKNELIYTNPCNATTIPKPEKKKSVAMEIEEQEAFIKNCPKSTYGNFFRFALNTGTRKGETRALTWEDINFKDKTININKTASTIINRDEDAQTKTKEILSTAKTEKSTRVIPINERAMEILLEQQRKEESKTFVFSSKTGTILQERNLRRAFQSILDKSDLPQIFTIHTLRHTFATRLIEKGVNAKIISDLLGHSSIQVTFDIYGHAMPNQKAEALSLLD